MTLYSHKKRARGFIPRVCVHANLIALSDKITQLRSFSLSGALASFLHGRRHGKSISSSSAAAFALSALLLPCCAF
jgi:hypothetical protein